jgi:hypothetical protein
MHATPNVPDSTTAGTSPRVAERIASIVTWCELLDLREVLEAEYIAYLRGKPWWAAPLDSPKYARGQELSRQLSNLHLTLARAQAEAGGGLS